MFGKILEKITGRDDLERVAYKGDLDLLNDYLKTRRVWIPRKPRRFLDAADFTREQLLDHIRKDAQDLKGEPFEPWILVLDGKKRLPAFSNKERMHFFSRKISQDLNKVFGLGCFEVLLLESTKDLDLDFVDLNLFSEKSWEIAMKPNGQ